MKNRKEELKRKRKKYEAMVCWSPAGRKEDSVGTSKVGGEKEDKEDPLLRRFSASPKPKQPRYKACGCS